MKKLALYFGVFLLTSSCAPFVDSPFSDSLLRPERNLNQKSVAELGDIESDNVIRIAVFSDPHQNYKALDKITFDVNKTSGIDFIAGLGDYTNSGYNLEYDQFIDALEYLKFPKIMALGNHDSIGAGPQLFKKAFGPANFYFESATYRFIFFNANNLEIPDQFDPAWLKATVDSSTKPVVIFAHEQLRDNERYFNGAAATLGSVIEDNKVKLIFNGHNHIYDYSLDHGTIMMQCGRAEGESGSHWLLVEIQAGNFCVKRMDTLEQTCQAFK